MGEPAVILFIILLLLAVLTRESFLFILFYLCAGAYIAGRLWSSKVARSITYQRQFIPKAFPGQSVPVKVTITNAGWLPAVWVQITDFAAKEISENGPFKRVVSLGPHQSQTLEYTLKTRKRGYYPIGPFECLSGDLLGLSGEYLSKGAADHLTVFPKVVPIDRPNLPSRSPSGTLAHHQPIFEDASRPAGKREYRSGDPLRRIDWKSSASSGRLQVKQFAPSIDLQTLVMLDLNTADYYYRSRFDATELAIVAAASITSWVIEQRQSAGLAIHGIDPFRPETPVETLPVRKGRAHLMQMLELLARIQASEMLPFAPLIRQQTARLGWGTTLVVISGQADPTLLDELYAALRAGFNPVLVLCGEVPNFAEAEQRAKQYGIPLRHLRYERDLDLWRKVQWTGKAG